MGRNCWKMSMAALVLLLNVWETLQNRVPANFSRETLRLAKAAQMKAYMNEDVEACDDFYEFACGKWERLHPATVLHKKTSYLDQLDELFVQKSVYFLEDISTHDPVMEYTLKKLFLYCNDTESLQKVGLKRILDVPGFKGGWPNITAASWYEQEYDWLKVVAELRLKLGVDIIIGLEIVPDFEDEQFQKLKIGAPQLELGLKKEYLSESYEGKREEYKRGIERKLRSYFPYKGTRWCSEVAHQVLHVEQQLARGLPDNPKLTLKQTTRLRTTTELRQAYGSFVNLNRYLTLVYNESFYQPLYETPEDYFPNLMEVIQKLPKLTIANYTMWRVLQQFNVEDELHLYTRPEQHKRRESYCVDKVLHYFPDQLKHLYYEKNRRDRNEIESLWLDIKTVMRDELKYATRYNWINSHLRQGLIDKLEDARLEFLSHTGRDFKQEMKDLKWWGADYYDMLINIIKWQTQHKLASLVQTPVIATPQPVEEAPKYDWQSNVVRIPVKYLQPRVFWDPAYPDAMKYATMGYLLAHELLQGFDNYFKEVSQHNFIDTETEKSFDERANCFTRQYKRFNRYQDREVADPNLRSNSIIDNGALALAYRAFLVQFERRTQTQGHLEAMPHFRGYIDYHLFFIFYAQLWCADYHSSVPRFTELPESIRVNGAVANFKPFAEQFECKNHSKLNPRERCELF